MSHYKPYPAYKDSGVEWLGRVPEHWSIRQLKSLARLTTGITPPTENSDNYADEGFPWVRPEDLDELGRPTLASKFLSEIGKGHVRQVSEESSLICCIGTIGKVGYVDRAVSTNQQITSAEFHTSGRFFFYTLQASLQALDAAAVGNVIRILNMDRLGSISYPQPSAIECSVIAAHLDRETARIDALVAKKTRFIELLREKRQALITHAVTKGLDPNVKMKDSGVEWLGEVPEHWRVMAIKHIVATPITDGPHETPEFLDEGVPFVSAEAVSSGRVDFRKIRGFISRDDHERYSQKFCPQRGDIFMIKSGATTGVTAIVETDDEFNIWSPLAVIRCGEVSDPYFVLNFMRSRSFQEAVALSWSYGTQQNIGMGVIGNLAVTVPPLEEQQRIAQLIQAKCGRLDALVEKTECSIDLLKERRSALITAAVTGQIDLRETA